MNRKMKLLVVLLLINACLQLLVCVVRVREYYDSKQKYDCPPGVTKIGYSKGIDCHGDTVNVFEYADRKQAN